MQRVGAQTFRLEYSHYALLYARVRVPARTCIMVRLQRGGTFADDCRSQRTSQHGFRRREFLADWPPPSATSLPATRIARDRTLLDSLFERTHPTQFHFFT